MSGVAEQKEPAGIPPVKGGEIPEGAPIPDEAFPNGYGNQRVVRQGEFLVLSPETSLVALAGPANEPFLHKTSIV